MKKIKNEEYKYNAIYCRESTKAQAKDGYNLVEQEKKCKAYIELEEWKEEQRVFSEYGASAKTLNRKELNRLFKEIKSGQVKRIIVYKLDRIVRRLSSLNELLVLLKKYDVKFVSVREKIDTDTALGRMFINLVVLFAEWEQDTISERTIEGLIGGASVGNYIKGGKAPFGYKRYKERQVVEVGGILKEVRKVGLRAIDKEIEIVRKMFKWALEGKSVLQIVLLVNEIEYIKANKKSLKECAIRNILNNKIYCGIMPFRDKLYILDIEKVISEEEFILAHNTLRQRANIRVNDYVYKNKIYCTCGEMCVHEPTNKMNACGLEIYLYYKCPKCVTRINEKTINYYTLPNLIHNYKKYKKDVEVVNLHFEIKKIEELRENIYQMYKKGEIKKDTYVNALIKYEQDYKEMQDMYSSYINDFEFYFNSLEYKKKVKLVSKEVKKIIVDMKMKVPLNVVYLTNEEKKEKKRGK